VSEATVRARPAARFDDQLELRAKVAQLGRTAVTTEIDVVRDGELLVAGRLRHVCVSTHSIDETKASPCPWPSDIRAGLTRFLRDPS
jgi:acyl-CoA thioester hydrolase